MSNPNRSSTYQIIDSSIRMFDNAERKTCRFAKHTTDDGYDEDDDDIVPKNPVKQNTNKIIKYCRIRDKGINLFAVCFHFCAPSSITNGTFGLRLRNKLPRISRMNICQMFLHGPEWVVVERRAATVRRAKPFARPERSVKKMCFLIMFSDRRWTTACQSHMCSSLWLLPPMDDTLTFAGRQANFDENLLNPANHPFVSPEPVPEPRSHPSSCVNDIRMKCACV